MPIFEFEIKVINIDEVKAESLEEAKSIIESKYKNELAVIDFIHEVKPMTESEIKEFDQMMIEIDLELVKENE